MRRSIAFSVVSLVIVACSSEQSAAPTNDSGVDTPIDTRSPNQALFDQSLTEIEALRVEYGVPGVAVAVVLDGSLAFSAGLGVRSTAASDAVTSKTLFMTGSGASKLVVAGTLLDMQEDGKLDLHRPVHDYSPSLQFTTHPEITVQQALVHRTGLATHVARTSCPPAVADLAGWFASLGPLASWEPPDTVWLYQGLG